ncbi:TylF/MycF family methyltransferase [Ancylobacter sp. Lp-2]|uniref:TylF/MycF family methyltransferase n=1 Tax=Ancylobacter sp. Lp-2 TaxID=2881339 RepID=UPI001E3FAAD6|nr:TylF/MycF family methyltransferase [Ancylobacter sp. Lp-2]MCB4768872.1 TylF/MycF family methyltransferase [Ancylobacter sp. Lp-2]
MLKSILRKAGYIVHSPDEFDQLLRQTTPSTDWNRTEDNYHRLSQEYFGIPLTRNIQNVKLHSIYKDGSDQFQRCFEALLNVESEYIQQLIVELAGSGVRGDFTEFGIFQGAWIDKLFSMTEVAGLADRQIWGFDSFRGLSEPHKVFDSSFWKKGMYAAGRELVEANVRAAERPRIRLVEGFFSDSLPTPKAQALGEVAFARIDCDIYEPAKECLAFLSHRLSHGSILVFDDWSHDFAIGEARAFAEWVDTVPHLRFKFIFLGPWDHLHLRVLHRDKPDIF